MIYSFSTTEYKRNWMLISGFGATGFLALWFLSEAPAVSWIFGFAFLTGLYLFIDALRTSGSLALKDDGIEFVYRGSRERYSYSDILEIESFDFSIGFKLVFKDGKSFVVNTKFQPDANCAKLPHIYESIRGEGAARAFFVIDHILREKTGKKAGYEI